MLRVIRNHRRAAHGERDGYEKLAIAAGAARPRRLPRQRARRRARKRAWDRRARRSARSTAIRNAQATVIAPTGTIGLVMDCDTTGIEPDFALVKFKKLAGGGYFKIINHAVPEALRTLGYARERDRRDRAPMPSATARSARRPAINHDDAARPRASPTRRSTKVEAALPTAFDIKFVFNQWTLGDEFCTDDARHHRPSSSTTPAFDLLAHLGFTQARDRGRQRPCLRRDDARRRAAPQARAPTGLRLRQPVRQDRQALPLGREPHPHDGGGAALHLRRDLQDHQHAERRDRRGLQGGLHAVLEAGAEGQRALPRRLQAVAAAATPADRRRRGRRGRRSRR